MSEGRTPAKRAISLSVILGTLLVPLSAVAALVLTDTADTSGESGSQTTTTTAVQTTAAPASVEVNSLDDDLAEACGPAGMELVTLEVDGSLTDVQQAALEALREVCDQEGMPLPAGPTPEPIIETVFVSDGSSATTTPTVPEYEDDDDYEYEEDENEDHDEDDDHEEDEDDEDHDDDEEDEDDEDEDR